MFIVVFVFDPCFGQIAMMHSTTGEIIERRLEHAGGEVPASRV
jgi:hypothetical protein